MSRLTVVLATLAASLGVTASAFAHADVVSRTPRPGSSLTTGPKTVTVTFTEQLRSGASIVVKRGSRVVLRGGNDRGNVKRLRASGKRLARGIYTVSWRATSGDGHHQHGSWSFRVR